MCEREIERERGGGYLKVFYEEMFIFYLKFP